MCFILISLFVFSTTNAHDLKNDSILINSNIISKNKIDNTIISSAVDSINYDIKNNKIFLYNDAEIRYKGIVLKAAYIELDSEKNIVFAKSLLNDSTSENYGYNFY